MYVPPELLIKVSAVIVPHPTYVLLSLGQSLNTLCIQIGCMAMAVVASPDPMALSPLGSTVREKFKLMMSGNKMPPVNSKSVTETVSPVSKTS